jgi:hypothetical protein
MRSPIDEKWNILREDLRHSGTEETLDQVEVNLPSLDSMYDATQSVTERGVVLDAAREVRVKLYMGQVWYSPFHFPFSLTDEGIHGLAMVHTHFPYAQLGTARENKACINPQ